MKKKLVTAVCSTLVAASAIPAFALTSEVTGFLRTRGIAADLSFDKDKASDRFVDQRFRAKWTLGVNEYVKVVYFGEIDFQFGDPSYGNTRNDGGGLGGDGINLETKNLYFEAAVPGTPVVATVGLQGFADNWDYSLFLADMSGIKLAAKNLGGKVDATLGWFKLYEEFGGSPAGTWGTTNAPNAPANSNGVGGSRNNDDITLWALQTSMKPMDALKVGADLYYLNNQKGYSAINFASSGQKDQLWYFGVNAAYKLPMANLSFWGMYNFGTLADGDVDVSGFAANLKADAPVADGLNVGARLLYYTSDDAASEDEVGSVVDPFYGPKAVEILPFASDGLMIMFADANQCTYPGTTAGVAGQAMSAVYRDGNGLLGFTVNGSYVPPTMKKLYAKLAAGYFTANDDTGRDGKSLGFEVATHVGYKLVDNLDLSLNAAYASLGSYYNGTATGGEDPDNPWIAYWMANVNF